jgi:hypothetical protein
MITARPEDLQALDVLKQAVAEALERKRRLGQYAVVWRDGRPAIIGAEQARMSLPEGQEPNALADGLAPTKVSLDEL